MRKGVRVTGGGALGGAADAPERDVPDEVCDADSRGAACAPRRSEHARRNSVNSERGSSSVHTAESTMSLTQ
eukprot:4117369-Pleurochrysis_carterae.AAC.1